MLCDITRWRGPGGRSGSFGAMIRKAKVVQNQTTTICYVIGIVRTIRTAHVQLHVSFGCSVAFTCVDNYCQFTTSGGEDGILQWCVAVFMAILKIAKFFCAFQFSMHVVACMLVFCSAAIMASLLVGSIGEFDTSTETFTAYNERLNSFSLRIVLAITLLMLPRLL